MPDRLVLKKTLKDGRVEAINYWPTGYDVLIYPSRAAFDRAKEAVEHQGAVPTVIGYTAA